MTVFFQSELFLQHDTGSHPESSARLKKVMDRILTEDITGLLIFDKQVKATSQEILRVHSSDYVADLKRFCDGGGGRIEADTVVSSESFEIACYAAGHAVEAVNQVIQGQTQRAFCAIRPPGHHALADQAMGFCLLNHVAIAARHAIEQHQLNRVLIVDWDVHHGNGTQDIFYEDEQVHFFSAHRAQFYPNTGTVNETGAGKGLGTIWNLPMDYGISRERYFSNFERVLNNAALKCRPELILISAGFDAHKDDPIGSLGLESDDFGELTQLVLNVANEYCDGRVVSLLEGGYNPEKLAESVVSHLYKLRED
ncbi:MAG: histone deacetylase [Planctomycetes bacterium]|nr:histone deacetylase [Planctomycetota bacterium]MCH9726680.1 histone deacetylase [Planctomycetota bacterium]MCH9779588.1 histone deacetylase [Planctomycetota bacterium]